MCNYLKRYCRTRRVSFMCCMICFCVIFNFMCFYYLKKTPSPWMSQYGPFQVYFNNEMRTCQNLKRSPQPLPLTALVSFPGSGNTWLRHMIQQVTGIATGSVYDDSSIKSRGFLAEGISDNTVSMIKTHGWGEQERSKYEKAVILLRDPFDSLKAEFNRQTSGHLGHAREMDYAKYWKMFIYENAKLWMLLYTDWLQFKGPLIVIQYENLKVSPEFEIRKLLKFLTLDYTEADIQCMLNNKEGRFRRNTSNVFKTSKRFTYYMKTCIKSYQHNVTVKLDKFLKRTKPS